MSDYDLTAPHLPLQHPQNVERRLREQIAGLLDQHRRDSAELRALCAARDEARAERDALRARIDKADAGTIVSGRANSYGGFSVEVSADFGWHTGMRVALVPLDD
jgi:hypothetical protein